MGNNPNFCNCLGPKEGKNNIRELNTDSNQIPLKEIPIELRRKSKAGKDNKDCVKIIDEENTNNNNDNDNKKKLV